MIGARAVTQGAGATRTCPHCRATILESAIVCPGCRHHLRFDKDAKPGGAAATHTAWQIDGSRLAPDREWGVGVSGELGLVDYSVGASRATARPPPRAPAPREPAA